MYCFPVPFISFGGTLMSVKVLDVSSTKTTGWFFYKDSFEVHYKALLSQFNLIYIHQNPVPSLSPPPMSFIWSLLTPVNVHPGVVISQDPSQLLNRNSTWLYLQVWV